MITVPTLGSMLTVVGVALLAVVVLSALVGVLLTRADAHHGATTRPAGGTPAPEGTAPRPAPSVPGPRERQTAGV